MRKIALFLVGLLLLIGGLIFYQKETQARWSDACGTCTNTNCCGERCESGYFCNNVGYGICYCKEYQRAPPLTATPGPRPPTLTQPGGGGGGGGGPTPTGGYVLGNVCQRNPACDRSCHPQTQDYPDGYACPNRQGYTGRAEAPSRAHGDEPLRGVALSPEAPARRGKKDSCPLRPS